MRPEVHTLLSPHQVTSGRTGARRPGARENGRAAPKCQHNLGTTPIQQERSPRRPGPRAAPPAPGGVHMGVGLHPRRQAAAAKCFAYAQVPFLSCVVCHSTAPYGSAPHAALSVTTSRNRGNTQIEDSPNKGGKQSRERAPPTSMSPGCSTARAYSSGAMGSPCAACASASCVWEARLNRAWGALSSFKVQAPGSGGSSTGVIDGRAVHFLTSSLGPGASPA